MEFNFALAAFSISIASAGNASTTSGIRFYERQQCNDTRFHSIEHARVTENRFTGGKNVINHTLLLYKYVK